MNQPQLPHPPQGYGPEGYPVGYGPAFVPTGTPPPPQPAAPYGAPPQGYAPVFVPGGYAPPPFAIGRQRDPRTQGASKLLNRMCLLVLLQSAAAFAWDLLFTVVMSVLGVNILTDPMAYQWCSAALVPLSTALPFFLYLLVGGRDPGEYLRFEKAGFLTALLCVLGGLCLCLLGNFPALAIQDFFARFGYEPMADMTAGNESWPMFLVELFSTAVVVPVMEEFAFRGVLLSALRKYGAGFAITASALVFSLVHMDFANVVFALISGLVFGFLYVRTGNLWITIAIHALNNALAVTGSYGEFLFGGMADLAGDLMMVVPLVLGAAALVFLAVRRRGLFCLRESPPAPGSLPPLTGGEAAGAIARAPLLWVIVGMMVLYTLSLFLM